MEAISILAIALGVTGSVLCAALMWSACVVAKRADERGKHDRQPIR
jgi:hypothetical protein